LKTEEFVETLKGRSG